MSDTIQAYLVGIISGIFLLAAVIAMFQPDRRKK